MFGTRLWVWFHDHEHDMIAREPKPVESTVHGNRSRHEAELPPEMMKNGSGQGIHLGPFRDYT